jgi:membrane-associated phospholipid phosphatase
MSRAWIWVAAGAIAITLDSSAVAADPGANEDAKEPPLAPEPAYRLSAAIDAPALMIPAALSASWLLGPELEGPYCAPECDPEDLNFIDEPAAGLYSPTWSKVGDVATVSVLASMPLFLAVGEGPLHALSDFVVVAEATLFASATQVLTSYAVARPRPRVYGDAAPLEQRDDGIAARSFFSGHTATCVAATISTFQTLQSLGHPELAWAALGFGGSGSILLSVARVGSGAHFPTDVAAGAVIGAGFGFLVPAIHAKTNAAPRSAVRSNPTDIRYQLVPVVTGERAGGAFTGVF